MMLAEKTSLLMTYELFPSGCANKWKFLFKIWHIYSTYTLRSNKLLQQQKRSSSFLPL